jgi:glycosyltransferase involved in cell wall biosynthesis
VRKPLVSVAIITYNQVEFIAEAVRSAAEQDYDPLEVVVADDGSTDGTADVVLQLAEQYPKRVIPLVGGPNLGITGNSNRALAACRGKYVAFQGGDDVLLPRKISAQVEWLERDERRVLCGHDVEVFDSATGERLFLWSERFGLRRGKGAAPLVRRGVPFCATAVMVRGSAIPASGFDERLAVVSDWKLWIDCLASGGQFGYVDGVYARYRRHEGNITNAYHEVRQDDQFVTLALVESRYPHLVSSCRRGRAELLRSAGTSAFRRGEIEFARAYFLHALRQARRPFVRPLGGILLTLLPGRLAAGLVERFRPNTGTRALPRQ